jgi:hypothetical protein
MRFKALVSLTLLLPVLLVSCGKDEKKSEDPGLSVPDSIISEAAVTPVTLKAFDAALIKSDMEGAGYTYQSKTKDDTSDPSCSEKLTNVKTIEALGSTVRAVYEVDTSACIKEDLEKSEPFKGADFTGLTASSSERLIVYYKCEGANLSAYNGKTMLDIENGVPECDKASRSDFKLEIILEQKTSGIIKLAGDTPTNYTYETDYKTNVVFRGEGLSVCSSTLSGAELTFSDSCREIQTSVITSKIGVVGSEENGEDNGKMDYTKMTYSGLKRLAESQDPWYSAGAMNVVRNDWTGTVKYSSPTAEPIFEMKKGVETVTGTIKKEAE